MLIYIKLEIFKIEQEYFDVYSLLPQRYHNLILKSWCLIDTQNPPVLVSRIILWNNWLDLSTVNCRTNSFVFFFFCLRTEFVGHKKMPFTASVLASFYALHFSFLSSFEHTFKLCFQEHCPTKWIRNKLIWK